MMKKWLSLVILATVISGCNSSVQNSVKNGEQNQEIVLKGEKSMKTIEYKIIKKSSTPRDQVEYMEGKKANLVFHSDDKTEVEAFNIEFEKLTGEEAPEFNGVMLISKMGTKSTGGYSIEVETVTEGDRYVEVTIINKAPQGLATMAYTNPFIIVNIPNTHKDLKIIEK
jgi:PBP1b-binding outer membrane lipoprotein LpoB